MRVSTLVIILAILGGGGYWLYKSGYFEKKQQEDEALFSTHANRGFRLYTVEKYDDAIKEFEKALAIDSKCAEAPPAMVRMGDCYRELKNPQKAIEIYQKVVQDYPDFKMRGQVLQTIEKTKSLGQF